MKIYGILVFCLLSFLSVKAVADEKKELSVPIVEDGAWSKQPATLQVAWSTTDYLVDKYKCPTSYERAATQKLVAWRGERIHAKLLVWSSADQGTIDFTVTQPGNNQWVDEATTGFMTYVMTDELNKDKKGGCGYRPNKAEYDSLLVADRISPLRTIKYEAKTVRPVWITFDVPRDAAPGVYKGSITVKSEQNQSRTLQYTIQVVNRTLPLTADSKFHLDLWQNPFAVARVANVSLWSKEHFDAMRPLMERLAKAGQRGVTASITHKPWNGQTYDYFENMITEVKKVDGTWMYDYTVFDRWVEFMFSCGVRPYIYCYSVIPWELKFSYYDQATNSMVAQKMDVDKPEFDEYWISKLKAFAAHLKEKGWFDQTIIAMDERPEKSMKAALRVIREADPAFKISLAGTYHEDLNDEIYDYCIAYDYNYPDGIVAERRAKGKVTTFYTCCSEAYPNTFTFSQPIEAVLFGLIAEERGLDGYLRWAYNSWVESPCQDSRFTAWAGGDTYLVYPANSSSVRFEKMIEGIQMFEKMQVLKADPRNDKALRKLLQPFAYSKVKSSNLPEGIRKVNAYLNSK